jgi:hypothetical protein
MDWHLLGLSRQRCFVLLRLGHLDEAIAVYYQTLALNRYLSTTLYGRGIAHAPKARRCAQKRTLLPLNALPHLFEPSLFDRE